MIRQCLTSCWRRRVGKLSLRLRARVPVSHHGVHPKNFIVVLTSVLSTAPPRPSQPAPDGPSARVVNDDIPPVLFDDARRDGGTSTSGRVCPHCTFENSHGGNDCEVCGLPL
jgi:nuclear protein localization family protein 4